MKFIILMLVIAVILYCIISKLYRNQYKVTDEWFSVFCKINKELHNDEHKLPSFSAYDIISILSGYRLIKYGNIFLGNISYHNRFNSIYIDKTCVKIGNSYWIPSNKEELQKVFLYLLLSPSSQIIPVRKIDKFLNNYKYKLNEIFTYNNLKDDNIYYTITYSSSCVKDDKISIAIHHIDEYTKETFVNIEISVNSELNDIATQLILYFGIKNNFKFNYKDDISMLISNISEYMDSTDKLMIESSSKKICGSIATLLPKDSIPLYYEYICDVTNIHED